MKKINRLLPIMTALMLCFPALTVQAAPWQKNQQAPTVKLSGLEGTVTILLEEINSLEGNLKVIEKPQGGSASFDTVNVVCSDLGAQGMSKNGKILLSSSGAPMDVTLNIPMTFTAEGTYVLELDGGVTNAEGFYENFADDPDEYICRVKIQAGDSAGGSSSNQPSGGDFNYNSEFNLNINVETEELEEAIEKVAEAIKSDEQLKMMQELLDKMNHGISLLEGGDQESVDKAAKELEESLEEIEAAEEEAETTEPVLEEVTESEAKVEEIQINADAEESAKGIPMIVWLILAILVLLALVAGAYFIYRSRKNKKDDYDGAPMVEYNIEDDDE